MDLLVTKPWGVKGYVAVGRTASTATASEAAMAATKATLLQLRTPTSVLEFHKCFTLPPIRLSSSIDSSNDRQGTTSKGAVRIYERLIAALQSGEAVVPTLLSKDKGGQGASSFRVSTERAGRHDFSSSEVEFEAGGALQEHYGTRARMKGFEVCVRVDVIGERVLVGTLLSQPDMAKRRKYKCAQHSLLFSLYVRLSCIRTDVAVCILCKDMSIESPSSRTSQRSCSNKRGCCRRSPVRGCWTCFAARARSCSSGLTIASSCSSSSRSRSRLPPTALLLSLRALLRLMVQRKTRRCRRFQLAIRHILGTPPREVSLLLPSIVHQSATRRILGRHPKVQRRRLP